MLNDGIRFGTDGWRGRIAREFTFENVTLVARALARLVAESENPSRTVIVAYDTRFMAQQFARRVAEVLTSTGLRIQITGSPTPTPVLSYAVREAGAAAGVMLTASHNPSDWLGIKLKEGFGGSALPKTIAKVERYLSEPEKLPSVQPDLRLIETVDLKSSYLQHLTTIVDSNRIASARINGAPLRVAIDPMHGAGIGYLRDFFEGCGVETIEIRNTLDPLFGGCQPEPLDRNLGPLRDAVLREQCVAGFATDGDADRIGAMDADGHFVDPHKIFSLILCHLVERRGFTGDVARTFSVSNMIDRIAEKYGMALHVVPVGFKYIAELMLEKDLLIGGEESGGIGVRFHLPERDGLLNSLLLAEVLATEEMHLEECVKTLHSTFGPLHYRRADFWIHEAHKKRALEYFQNSEFEKIGRWHISDRENLDGYKFILEKDRWVLVRASGTEPLLRVYAEAETPELADEILASVGKILDSVKS